MSEDKEYEEGIEAWKYGQRGCPYDPWLYPMKSKRWNKGWMDMEERSKSAWNTLEVDNPSKP